MKFTDNKDIPFTIKTFFDENFELITPENTLRFQIGLFDHFLDEHEVIAFYDSNSVDENFSKNEKNYLNFIEQVFQEFPTEMFVEIEIKELSNFQIIEILNSLDYEDKNLWIEFIKKLDNANSKLIKLESKNELKMFFKIITRELTSPIFHFENGKVNLLGNYDLFFPMFFENNELADKYREIALENNLHILKITN
ncbi:MAG: hypothetical protein K0M56_02765 [Kaistella sp.]|nr:hypothetical protein [Kaistella sp.]